MQGDGQRCSGRGHGDAIFAIGDLRRKYANQIMIALADGSIASLAAANYGESPETGVLDPRPIAGGGKRLTAWVILIVQAFRG